MSFRIFNFFTILIFLLATITTAQEGERTATSTSNINVRATASSGSSVVTVLSPDETAVILEEIEGQELTINGATSDIWYHISVDDTEGFVWSGLVELGEPAEAPEPLDIITTEDGIQYPIVAPPENLPTEMVAMTAEDAIQADISQQFKNNGIIFDEEKVFQIVGDTAHPLHKNSFTGEFIYFDAEGKQVGVEFQLQKNDDEPRSDGEEYTSVVFEGETIPILENTIWDGIGYGEITDADFIAQMDEVRGEVISSKNKKTGVKAEIDTGVCLRNVQRGATF
jgi:hypothetical protein